MIPGKSSVLVFGGSGEEREAIAHRFIVSALKKNKPCMYVNIDKDAKAIMEDIKKDHDIDEHIKNSSFHIIDCFSAVYSKDSEHRAIHPRELHKINTAITEILSRRQKPEIVVINTITGFLNHTDLLMTESFLEFIIDKLKRKGATVLLLAGEHSRPKDFANIEVLSDMSMEIYHKEADKYISLYGVTEAKRIANEMKMEDFLSLIG